MPQFLSLDGLTPHYYETRTFDPARFASAITSLARRFPPRDVRALVQ
jgi:hypothetical protein